MEVVDSNRSEEVEQTLASLDRDGPNHVFPPTLPGHTGTMSERAAQVQSLALRFAWVREWVEWTLSCPEDPTTVAEEFEELAA